MDKFRTLSDTIIEAGNLASDEQYRVSRRFKPDGSVLTETDLTIDKLLSEKIRELFPDSNIISEECPSAFNPGKEYTFAIDPIDGTDAYSQGMPGWCVAVGVLDRELQPAGGIVYAPRWGADKKRGIHLFASPEGELLLNGEPADTPVKEMGSSLQIMVSSKVHRVFELSSFPGKVRSIGSSILHLVSPLVHPGIDGALLAPCYIWDIAAAHGILVHSSLGVETMEGNGMDYSVMVHRQKMKHHVVAGSPDTVAKIRQYLTRK